MASAACKRSITTAIYSLAEKGEALMRWEDYLDELLDPERKIVNFTRRKYR
jgi:hypothetical protein